MAFQQSFAATLLQSIRNDMQSSFAAMVAARLVQCNRGRRGCDRMVVGFTTTYAVGAYHH